MIDTILATSAVILWSGLIALALLVHFSHGKWKYLLAKELLKSYAIQQATLRFRERFYSQAVSNQTPVELMEMIEDETPTNYSSALRPDGGRQNLSNHAGN
jgi:hypothetical protein